MECTCAAPKCFSRSAPISLPGDAELQRGITAVAEADRGPHSRSIGEGYSGPVLFEPRAAAQLFAQVLGDNLKVTRKPVPDPGRPAPHLPSELENKDGLANHARVDRRS